ncbi:glycosyltransferase [Kitasatospora paracochleata]|uniref:Vancomycin aglycone glucosyltransferase n=1 Tax=Kitasatospora paracochleata TaxID=58354 RepID=A0ABT1J8M4_9ACTN|nr:glycosyltransferase [Kitasatospora paracochleata]MCP2313790.1 vancomycin aglycone glucosyltransferase [Kitasatospora paracochleata]
MRVVLSSWGSRGDVEPLAALAVRLRELGAEAVVCAPPDEEFAALLERVGVPLVPLGPSVRSVVSGAEPPSTQDAFRLAAELVAARFETLTAAAEGSDVLLATGLMPAGVRSVAERAGIRYVFACFHTVGLPSRHRPPLQRPGRPSSPDETDIEVLWDEDAQRVNALYGEALNRHRAAIGLPPVDNVRDHVLTERPWLAAEPGLVPWQDLTDLDVVRTGAWLLSDERPLPDDLEAFLAAGPAPVYVGFGSMAMRATPDLARVAVEAARAHGRRILLAGGWAGLAPIDDRDDCHLVGEVNHQALFRRTAAVVHHGGAGTTTTAALAGAPQVVVPQLVDQPYWAARIAELGIGAAHAGPAPTVDSLTAALAVALAPGTAVRAMAVAGAIRTDGATVAAKRLISGE